MYKINLISSVFVLLLVSCITPEINENYKKNDIKLSGKIGKIIFEDERDSKDALKVDFEREFVEEGKKLPEKFELIPNLTENQKTTISDLISNSLNNEGTTFNFAVIIKEAEIEYESEIMKDKVEIDIEVKLEVTNNSEDKPFYEVKGKLETSFDLKGSSAEKINDAYNKLLYNSVYNTLKELQQANVIK